MGDEAWSEKVVQLLSDLIQERTGMYYDAKRWDLMIEKLNPLIAERKPASLLDYYYYLKYDEHAAAEWLRVQTALAVNESYFWREVDQIRVAAEVLAPQLLKEHPARPARIWHAACATGEEPYSMAIALNEAGLLDPGAVEIIATDFNPVALSLARAGLYRARSFRSLPADLLARYFIPTEGGAYRLVDSIRSRVEFTYLNLVDETAMQRIPEVDMVFCRNAFIYFADATICQVLDGFARVLTETGLLFVAAAESLLRLDTRFELVEVDGVFAYRKGPVYDLAKDV